VQQDLKTGDYYYYNASTNETSWEIPSSDSGVGVDSHCTIEDIGASEHPVADLRVDVLKLDAMDEPLAKVNSTSNHEPLHGLCTQGAPTSGDRSEDTLPPEDAEANIASDAQDGAMLDESWTNDPETEVAEEEYVSFSKVSRNLPPGWSTGSDPDSGETFYFNGETGETSWDIPAGVQESVMSQAGTTGGRVNVSSATTNDETTPEETPKVRFDSTAPSDGNEGHVNAFEEAISEDKLSDERGRISTYQMLVAVDTKISSTERSVNKFESQPETDTPEEVLANVQVNTPLSDVAAIDAKLAIDQNKVETEDLDTSLGGTIGNEVLPIPWVEEIDPRTGEPYYFNPSTLETTWDKPVAGGVEQHSYPTSREDENANMGVSEQGYNHDLPGMQEIDGSDMTSWTRPHSVRLPDLQETIREDGGDATLDVNRDNFANELILDVNVEPDPQVLDDLDKSSVSDSCKWSQLVDPATGMTYYYQTETGETSWEPPIEYCPSGLGTRESTGLEQEISDDYETSEFALAEIKEDPFFYLQKTLLTSSL
jgi:hypothetical protein